MSKLLSVSINTDSITQHLFFMNLGDNFMLFQSISIIWDQIKNLFNLFVYRIVVTLLNIAKEFLYFPKAKRAEPFL
jgi:hypothetical protein